MSKDTTNAEGPTEAQDRIRRTLEQLGSSLTGLPDAQAAQDRLNKLAKLPAIADKKEAGELVLEIGRAVEAHSPRDAIEADLVTMNVALENAAFHALSRFQDLDQPLEIRTMYARHAEKTFALALRYLEALEKKRRAGVQRVVVEHRVVEAREARNGTEFSLDPTDTWRANDDNVVDPHKGGDAA